MLAKKLQIKNKKLILILKINIIVEKKIKVDILTDLQMHKDVSKLPDGKLHGLRQPADTKAPTY